MDLIIIGSRKDVRLGVSNNGNWVLSGSGDCADPEFENSRAGLVDGETQKIRVAFARSIVSWSIVSADGSKSEFDLEMLGLASRITHAPDSPHCSITCSGNTWHSVCVHIVLPSTSFMKVKEVISHIISTPDTGFRVSISGIGVDVPVSGIHGPKPDDFLEGGVPLLSTNVLIEMEPHP